MDEERQFVGSHVGQEWITLHNGQGTQLTVIDYHDIHYNQYSVVIRNQNLSFLLKCLGYCAEGVLYVSVVQAMSTTEEGEKAREWTWTTFVCIWL